MLIAILPRGRSEVPIFGFSRWPGGGEAYFAYVGPSLCRRKIRRAALIAILPRGRSEVPIFRFSCERGAEASLRSPAKVVA